MLDSTVKRILTVCEEDKLDAKDAMCSALLAASCIAHNLRIDKRDFVSFVRRQYLNVSSFLKSANV